jgi:hypothetical protein
MQVHIHRTISMIFSKSHGVRMTPYVVPLGTTPWWCQHIDSKKSKFWHHYSDTILTPCYGVVPNGTPWNLESSILEFHKVGFDWSQLCTPKTCPLPRDVKVRNPRWQEPKTHHNPPAYLLKYTRCFFLWDNVAFHFVRMIPADIDR